MQNTGYGFLAAAKRFVRTEANHYRDIDLLIKRSDISGLTPNDQKEVLQRIERRASALRRAFETRDEFTRDWFLFWARKVSAEILEMDKGLLGAMVRAGGIPMTDTIQDRYLFVVQKRLAALMFFCQRAGCEHPCFFAKRPNRYYKYCSTACRDLAHQEDEREYYHRRGKQWREEKRIRASAGIS